MFYKKLLPSYYKFLYLFFILIYILSATYPIVPLTYDEAWNFSNIVIKGTKWIFENYPFANNHVLFSLLQNILIPKKLVYYWPAFLRIPNILYSLIFIILLSKFLHANIQSRILKITLILSFVFSSPLLTLYFFVARGYILALLLLFCSTYYLVNKKIILSAIFLSLSVYTIPTFVFVAPGMVLFLSSEFLFFNRTNNKGYKYYFFCILKLSLISSIITYTLYSPILDQLFKQKNVFSAYPSSSEFISALMISISSFGELYKSVLPNFLLIIIAPICIFSPLFYNNYNKNKFQQLALLLSLCCLSGIVFCVLGIKFNFFGSPFLRSVIYIPVFIQIIFSCLIASIQNNKFKKIAISILILQGICGFHIWTNHFIFGKTFTYPYFSALTPTPIEKAIHAGKIPKNASLIISEWTEPVLSIYKPLLNYKFSISKDLKVNEKCIIGKFHPPINQKINIKIKNGSKMLCY